MHRSHANEASDEECRKFPVTSGNIDKKICIKNPQKDQGCIEKELCTTIEKTGNDCSSYPVSNNNIDTHTCQSVDGSDKCSEVQIQCLSAKKGDSDDQCSKYKVSDEKNECVKNTDTSANATPCIEKEKTTPEPEPEIKNCEDVKTGATDEICSTLSVEKEGEQICVKNKSGDNCELLFYCQYGEGNSDEDCSKYALKDKEKTCKKKADENKCEEVGKTEDDTTGKGDDKNSGNFLSSVIGLLLLFTLI